MFSADFTINGCAAFALLSGYFPPSSFNHGGGKSISVRRGEEECPKVSRHSSKMKEANYGKMYVLYKNKTRGSFVSPGYVSNFHIKRTLKQAL